MIAAYLAGDYKKHRGRAPDIRIGLFEKISLPPYGLFPSLERPKLPIIPLLALGLSIGVITGIMGVSGVLLLPALVYLAGQRTVKATGTSLLLVWISALIGVIRKAHTSEIHIFLLIALLLGGITGTLIGTRIGLRLKGPRIRLYFVYVVILTAALIAAKLITLTF